MAFDFNEYQNRRYHERRALMISILGGMCAKCGSTDELEMDHVDPKSKVYSFTQIVLRSLKVFLDEVAKCQLLCGKCHTSKTVFDAGNKPAEHGTLSMYRYCKCEPCRAAKSAYSREYSLRSSVVAALGS